MMALVSRSNSRGKERSADRRQGRKVFGVVRRESTEGMARRIVLIVATAAGVLVAAGAALGVGSIAPSSSGLEASAALGVGSTAPSSSGPQASVTGMVDAARPAPRMPLKATGILRYGESYPKASGYDRYAYIVVSRHHAHAAARLPGVSLPYTSGTTVYPSWNSGVTYTEALSNGWILRDGNGNPVANAQYGGYVADIGDPAYQRRFIANQLSFLKRNRNDGIFLDDVLTSPLGLGGTYPAKYPSNEAWENAVVSFVAAVGQAVKAKGYYLLVNAGAYIPGDAPSQTVERYPRFFRELAPHVDGLMMEGWMQNPGDLGLLRSVGSDWSQNWDAWQSLLASTQAAGAAFFGLTYGTASNVRAMRYGRAAFLLDWSGRDGAYMYVITDRDDPFHPTWVRQHGKPLGAKVERLPGVWQRRYEHAIVVLNANQQPVSLRVGGHSFTIGATDALFARPHRK
jgi:hypothetical protein